MRLNYGQILNFLKKYTVLIFTVMFFLFLVLRVWPTTWDDSGITLAFSKNLARYGDIVPTALSGRVEGYSSFLWMILNFTFFRAGLDENTVLFAAKTLATFFAVLNIICFWKLIRENVKTPLYQVFALVLFTFNSYTIASAVDGMETSLYALLLILSFLLYKKRNQGVASYIQFTLIASLLIIIRQEGPLFLLPFVLAIFIEKRKYFFREPFLYFWAIVFILYQSWHYSYFGEVLTNPMLAKRYWPYRPEFNSIATFALYYINPLLIFIYNYIGLFILIPAHFFLRKKFSQLNKEKEPWGVVILVAVMAIIIMVITGSNWGAAARLGYPGLAFLLLLLFAKIDDAPFFAQNNLLKILTIIGFSLNAVAIYYSINSVTPDIITLAGVERRASTISTMQIVLHRPVVTFAGVDMGGLLLYHGDGKKIIDLGLLCDRELGKNGYAHLEEYLFQKMKPEIIEAHGFWLEPLRNTRSFKTMYIPVMVLTDRNEQILYLRKDILAELKSNYEMPYATARAGFKDIDQATLEQLGSFPVLNLKSTQ